MIPGDHRVVVRRVFDLPARTRDRSAVLTAAVVGKTAATSGSRVTTTAFVRYRAAYGFLTAPRKSYSGAMSASIERGRTGTALRGVFFIGPSLSRRGGACTDETDGRFVRFGEADDEQLIGVGAPQEYETHFLYGMCVIDTKKAKGVPENSTGLHKGDTVLPAVLLSLSMIPSELEFHRETLRRLASSTISVSLPPSPLVELLRVRRL